MSRRKLDRLAVIQAVAGRQLRQCNAAGQLGLGVRQVKRLVRSFRKRGAAGLVSNRRGKRPNNTIADAVRTEVLAQVRRRYADFGPTLAHEKLTEGYGDRFSVETLRQWMTADGLWQPKRYRQARVHPRRPRRPCLGELVQSDGSPHDWFEERGPRCTLIVFIDDATSRLMALRFAPAETTRVYMETLCGYLGHHSRPVALYSDKHSIFRVNHPDHEGELTQFSRALKTLDIAPIHANTPQAKGRVERANQTLQDHLVKELRLRGISDIDTANAFLPEFIVAYNVRFAVTPLSPADAHREVLHDAQELEQILCLHATRKLSKNLAFQFKNRQYQIQDHGKGHRLRRAIVTVCEAFDGGVTLLYEGRQLSYRILAEGEPPFPWTTRRASIVHHGIDHVRATQVTSPPLKATTRPSVEKDHPVRSHSGIELATMTTSAEQGDISALR